MSISQISVFIESKPGMMKQALDVMAAAGANIRGYCASDTGDFGIVRFVVDNTEAGLKALVDNGFAAKVKPVVCVRLKDDPGELSRALGVISQAGINLEYSYSLVGTYICLQVEGDLEAVEKLLERESFELVNDNDFFE